MIRLVRAGLPVWRASSTKYTVPASTGFGMTRLRVVVPVCRQPASATRCLSTRLFSTEQKVVAGRTTEKSTKPEHKNGRSGLFRKLEIVKEIFLEYKRAFGLFYQELKWSLRLVRRYAQGHRHTRRERHLLRQAATDLFRVLPFAASVMTTGMTITNLVTVRVFPVILPSHFKPILRRFNEKKFDADLDKRVKEQVANAELLSQAAIELVREVEKENEDVSTDDIRKIVDIYERIVDENTHVNTNEFMESLAPLFSKHITLDDVPRIVLQRICAMLNIGSPFLTSGTLRVLIRTEMRSIRKDDKDIYWEGVSNMTEEELLLACKRRGLLTKGLDQYPRAVLERRLRAWLELSINPNSTTTLMCMYSAFKVRQTSNEEEAFGIIGVKKRAMEVERDSLRERISQLSERLGKVEGELEEVKRFELIEERRREVGDDAGLEDFMLPVMKDVEIARIRREFCRQLGSHDLRRRMSISGAREVVQRLGTVSSISSLDIEENMTRLSISAPIDFEGFVKLYNSIVEEHDGMSWHEKKQAALERLEQLDREMAGLSQTRVIDEDEEDKAARVAQG